MWRRTSWEEIHFRTLQAYAAAEGLHLASGVLEVLPDGWTVLPGDRMPSAPFEHTVLVKNEVPEVLTCKKMK